jgi:hypothetical protein
MEAARRWASRRARLADALERSLVQPGDRCESKFDPVASAAETQPRERQFPSPQSRSGLPPAIVDGWGAVITAAPGTRGRGPTGVRLHIPAATPEIPDAPGNVIKSSIPMRGSDSLGG